MFEEIDIYICKARSFCFGVIKAIEKVELALQNFGSPVYVLHEIVHNKHVVESLKQKGAIFVEKVSDADISRPLIFSAHGVSKKTIQEAENLNIEYIDATCPLVGKVHKKIADLENKKYEIIVIGKKNHQEIIGTLGQLQKPEKAHIINSIEEIHNVEIKSSEKIGFVTQTTLSVDETSEIIASLKNKYPNIETLSKTDICLATTQRQESVKNVSRLVDIMIIIGSKNSSNSNKLKEVAIDSGAKSILIDDASELNINYLKDVKNIGITAGASAPEYLIEEVINKLKIHYKKINIHTI